MKNYIQEFSDELDDFLTIKVVYNKHFNQYQLNGIWVSEINNSYFQERLDKLEKLLYNQLKHGKNNNVFLLDTIERIRKVFNLFYDHDHSEFSFFEKSDILIKKTSSSKNPPNVELYNYDYFINKLYNKNYIKESFQNQEPDVINYHNYFADYFLYSNHQPSIEEFEKEKLMKAIISYEDNVYKLMSKIELLELNCDKIDFSKMEVEDFKIQINSYKNKCKLNINKKNFAELINFLMIEKYIFFDSENEANNKILLQKFFQNNFTYKSLNTKQEDIKSLNREISESHFDIKENYNNYIDNLIVLLESKKKVKMFAPNSPN